MADKTRTIKNATDKELTMILGRVRMEREALGLVRDLELKSTPNPKGPYPKYTTDKQFSTETPINNGLSIKEMTDEELSDFIRRLNNENELTRLVLSIKEINNPILDGEGIIPEGQTYDGINLDVPVNDLYHFGIPGMRWGIRKTASVAGEVSKAGANSMTEAGKISGTLSSRKASKIQDSKKDEAKKMSDTDLRSKISRMSMEQQYAQLAAKDISPGRSKTADILAVSGSILAITATAATAALTIKQLIAG